MPHECSGVKLNQETSTTFTKWLFVSYVCTIGGIAVIGIVAMGGMKHHPGGRQ